MKRFVHFFFFEVVSILTARNGPNQTVFIKSKMEGAVVGVGLSVSQNQQQDCITESIVTLWDIRWVLKRFPNFMAFFFLDGWWLLRVIRSESDTARVRSSPPAHNKTWERHTTMEWSWWRTFASNWPPPSRLGPPSQAWPVALSNPTQHLHISEWWIGTHSPSFHWHTQPCTFGLRSRGEVVFAVWTQPTIKPLTAGTQNHDLGPVLLGNLLRFASSRATSDVSVALVIKVM